MIYTVTLSDDDGHVRTVDVEADDPCDAEATLFRSGDIHWYEEIERISD